MKKEVGLWIDRRKAVIVIVTEAGDEIKKITSAMEKRVRFSGGTAGDGSSESARDNQLANHLNDYYDEVIAIIRDADTIQIFGPGEAKGELKKRLETAGVMTKILAVETVDKMTDRQIAAKVRDHLVT
jgi:hypothetical protein